MVEHSKFEKLRQVMIHVVFIAFSLFCTVPLLFIISASFTSELGLAQYGYKLIPAEFSTAAYEYIFAKPDQLLDAYGVTIFITLVGTAISLLITAMLAYVISRRDFPGRNVISFMLFFTMLFGGGLVPSYMTITQLYGLKNNIWVLILPCVMSAWNVYLMRGYFNAETTSLVEAAKVDGCSERSIFFRIVMPITKPGLATVGLLTAFSYWNQWYQSMLYTSDIKLTSLQYYLQRIMNNIQYLTSNQKAAAMLSAAELPSESARMALCVLAAGPMLVIFPFFQRYFSKGLTMGAVKG